MVIREVNRTVGGSDRGEVTVGVSSINTGSSRHTLFNIVVRHSFVIWMQNFVCVLQVKSISELLETWRDFGFWVLGAVIFG